MPSWLSGMVVKAAVGEGQGVAVAVVEVRHLAQVERVVTAVVRGPGLALEVGQDAGQPRRRPAFDPHRLRARPAGEMHGQLPLFGAQDVDGERPAGEFIVGLGAAGDADQDQRRLHGHGREGVHRDAVALGGAVEGHDGHAGGEPAQAAAEVVRPRGGGPAGGTAGAAFRHRKSSSIPSVAEADRC